MNLPAKIWVVYGETGEYSSCQVWDVAAYTSEEEANRHRDLAKKWYDDHPNDHPTWSNPSKNPFDSAMQSTHTGTEWHVYSLELREKCEPNAAPAAETRVK